MAIDPNTLLNGTTADADEVQIKFDQLFNNIDNSNIAAGAGIEVSKLETMNTGEVIVGTGAGVADVVTMGGDATIDALGNVTVNGGTPTIPLDLELSDGGTPALPADYVLKLQNNANAADGVSLQFITGSAGEAKLSFGDSVSASDGTFKYDQTNNRFIFEVGGTNIALIGGDGIRLIDGSAADPSYKFRDDTDTGIFRQGANSIGLSTNGIERVRIGNSLTQVMSGDLAVQSLSQIFLDGGNDTYLIESAANRMNLVVGGNSALEIDDTGSRVSVVSPFELDLSYIDPPTNIDYGNANSLVKAWGYVQDAGSPSVANCYNISSISRNVVGSDVTYIINFDTNMPSATRMAIMVTPIQDGGNKDRSGVVISFNASQCEVGLYDDGSADYDAGDFMFTVMA